MSSKNKPPRSRRSVLILLPAVGQWGIGLMKRLTCARRYFDDVLAHTTFQSRRPVQMRTVSRAPLGSWISVQDDLVFKGVAWQAVSLPAR